MTKEKQEVEGELAADEFKVQDRRHWQQNDDLEAADEVEPAKPSYLEAYRERAEAAENKLQEYIEAFKNHEAEQEQVRTRLSRDVDRKVELMFGELLGELLRTVDDLDLSLSHIANVPEAGPLAKGVAMARDRFLATLARHGVQQVSCEGQPFDPNEAEALRVDSVDSADRDGVVTEILQPGYKLGERMIRPAKVAVGRYDGS